MAAAGIGGSLCSLVADTVWAEIESARSVTDEQLSKLHFLFGGNLERAIRIVDMRGVKRVTANLSGRSVFQVMGESKRKEKYVCLGNHYCNCYAFFYDTVNRGEQLSCKHLLAARFASAVGECIEVTSDTRAKNGSVKEDGDKKIQLKPGFLMEHDEDVGAVDMGSDRYFNYYKIQYGTLCIRENPGCLFIATNRDAVTHLTDAQEWAGGGSMVGAIRGSTQKEPVVGKPSTFMTDYLSDKFGILKSQICMVGDRLDTDILFGQNGGCKTLLVL